LQKVAQKSMNPQNDIVFTDIKFAKRIIDYFSPQFKLGDKFFDPCKGSDGYCIHSDKEGGAFYKNMPQPKLFAELTEGIDCISIIEPIQWSITNPPFSAKAYRKVAQHCAKISDNVIFLVRLDVALGVGARIKDFTKEKLALKEIIVCRYEDAGFAARGFTLGVFHWQKNYVGDTKWTYWV
jgi:hypothetical protein